MADESEPIRMSVSGPVPFVLPPEPDGVMSAITEAGADLGSLRSVALRSPSSLFAWSALGGAELELVHRYAAYRIGYHRGLDALRGNGWRGSGDVRWSEPTNRGFLRSLLGLHLMSTAIDDVDEADRTIQFLHQLDRGGPPSDEVDAILRP